MFTIFVKRWKITSQTYQKYTEFASGCWIRKGVRQKKSLKKLTKLFLLTQQQVMNTYTHHTYDICQNIYLHVTKAFKQNTTTSINAFNKWNTHFADNFGILGFWDLNPRPMTNDSVLYIYIYIYIYI